MIHWIEWLVGTGRQRTAWRKPAAWNSRIFQGMVDPSGCCQGKQPALHFAAHVEAPSLKRCHLVRALIYPSHRISAFYCSMATEEMVGLNAGNTPSRVSWSAHSMQGKIRMIRCLTSPLFLDSLPQTASHGVLQKCEASVFCGWASRAAFTWLVPRLEQSRLSVSP